MRGARPDHGQRYGMAAHATGQQLVAQLCAADGALQHTAQDDLAALLLLVAGPGLVLQLDADQPGEVVHQGTVQHTGTIGLYPHVDRHTAGNRHRDRRGLAAGGSGCGDHVAGVAVDHADGPADAAGDDVEAPGQVGAREQRAAVDVEQAPRGVDVVALGLHRALDDRPPEAHELQREVRGQQRNTALIGDRQHRGARPGYTGSRGEDQRADPDVDQGRQPSTLGVRVGGKAVAGGHDQVAGPHPRPRVGKVAHVRPGDDALTAAVACDHREFARTRGDEVVDCDHVLDIRMNEDVASLDISPIAVAACPSHTHRIEARG